MSSAENWITFDSTTLQIRPDIPSYLRIRVDTMGLNPCGEFGVFWIDWGIHRDTITVSKSMPDNIPPIAVFTLSTTGTRYNAVTLDASSSYDRPCSSKQLQYLWKVNGQTVSYSQTDDYTFYNIGTYNVTLIVKDGINTTILTKQIQIT